MSNEAQLLSRKPAWSLNKLETNSDARSREILISRFLSERNVMERLSHPLTPEEFMQSASSETSPPKWHLAHTTWFYENFILKRFVRDYQVYNEAYEYLFNSYYRAVGNFLPKSERCKITKPSIDEVFAYRKSVTEQVAELFRNANGSLVQDLHFLIELGINHEQQHQELFLMDVKRNFFATPERRAYQNQLERVPNTLPAPTSVPPARNDVRWLDFKGGLHKFGTDAKRFHYDNEGGRHHAFLEPFQISSELVTQGEYAEFILAGGYENSEYWLSDGWDQLLQTRQKMPLYWEKRDGEFSVMTLSGMQKMNPDEPVSHVNYYEAQAFAHFKKARLPTEYEWEHAASFEPIEGTFLENGVLKPQVNEGFHGGVWEWTQSAYLPYPGYHALDQGLFEYNSKFMCNQFVLRGGSAITPRDHYRPTYRNFFYPHQAWQYSGFRLARDDAPKFGLALGGNA